MIGTPGSPSPPAPSPRRSFLLQPGREVAVEFGLTVETDVDGGDEGRAEAIECASDYMRAALEELASGRDVSGFELWDPPTRDAPAFDWPLDFRGHVFDGPHAFAAHLCAVVDRGGRGLHVHDSAGRAFRLHVRPLFHRQPPGREAPR